MGCKAWLCSIIGENMATICLWVVEYLFLQCIKWPLLLCLHEVLLVVVLHCSPVKNIIV